MADLTRHTDWQPRLVTYLGQHAARSFAWGEHDCALFAAGAIEAMTGTDLSGGAAGTYATRAEGMALLDNRDGLIGFVDRFLTRIQPSLARPGDVIAVGHGRVAALGILQGNAVYVLRDTGLGLVSRLDASVAWRVG